MPSTPVTVIARFKAKDGMVEQAKQALLALVEPTRAEPGCINYDLHQDPTDPARFVFYENWTSDQDLNQHLNKPHLVALRKEMDRLFDQPPQIERWTMTSDPAPSRTPIP